MQDFERFPTSELKAMQSEINNILERRQAEIQIQAWGKVVQAMKDYISKTGEEIRIVGLDNIHLLSCAEEIESACEQSIGDICVNL
jgi:hypothetical protein